MAMVRTGKASYAQRPKRTLEEDKKLLHQATKRARQHYDDAAGK
jgi:hypothetical protein